MLKKLGFGMILAVQVISIFPLLAQEKSDSSQHANDANQNNPIPQQSIVHQQDSGKNNEKGQVKDPPSAKDSFDYAKWGFWVNFGLTGITFLIAIASVIQASAARISAKAVMLSERAWLLPNGDKIGPPYLHPVEQQGPQKTPVHCTMALKNNGNTPASAIDWQFELQLGNSAESPPSFDVYKQKPPKDRLTSFPFPIAQDGEGRATAVLTPQEHISASDQTDIWDGKQVLWLCGIARYYDVFRKKRWFKRRPEEHLTFVCLRYICAPGGANGQWLIGGPSKYNNAT
jgi:hypothetical protein